MEDDSHGRTDLTSNAVFLGRFNGERYVTWLRNRNVRIEEELPQFLHEFTHHWCFNSYVGRALALIRLRSQISLVLDKSPHVPIEVDLARYETARLMLGPLSEGLALFSEFDLTPRDSPVLSQASAAAMLCFGFPLSLDPEDEARAPLVSLEALLQNARMNADFLHERKAPVYLRPFDVEDGYLPGYLAVKNLYLRATTRAKVLYDNEAFLCYAREIVFNDVRLAFELLADCKSEIQAAQAVADRVTSRLEWFAHSKELASDAEAFIAHILSSGARSQVGAGIDWDDALAERFHDVFASQTLGVIEMLDQSVEREQVIAGVVLDSLRTREFFTMARVDVGVRVTGGRLHLTLGDADLGEFAAKTHQWPETASLSVVISSSARILGLALSEPDHTEIIEVFGRLEEGEAAALEAYAVTNRLRSRVCDLFSEAFQDQVADSWLSVVQKHIRKNAHAASTELYAWLSTLIVSTQHSDSAKQELKESGFGAFLGDVRLAKVLAVVGIAHTMNADVAMLCHFVGPRMGIPAERMEAGLSRLRMSVPYPLIFGDSERVYASV